MDRSQTEFLPEQPGEQFSTPRDPSSGNETPRALIADSLHVHERLSDLSAVEKNGLSPHGAEEVDVLPIDELLSYLRMNARICEQFTEGSAVSEALRLANAIVCSALIDEPGINREAAHEAALEAFNALPALWRLQPSAELTRWWANAGALWTTRLCGDRYENQEQAIACYEAALSLGIWDGDPEGWAATQNDLGNLYGERLQGDSLRNKELAIASYESALTVITREADPHGWSTIMNNLGSAYRERLNGSALENKERAISYYKMALEVRRREVNPGEWAQTKSNLGAAYAERLLGNIPENQEKAIECFEAALSIRTFEDDPEGWAIIQLNLGDIYRDRFNGNVAENQERAIACCEAALKVFTFDQDQYHWAMLQHNLGAIYQVRITGDRGDNQDQAIDYYNAVLKVRSRQSDPRGWALTKNNLGNIYRERIYGNRQHNRDQAIACYQNALKVRSKEYDPYDWAATQNNLGLLYAERVGTDRAEDQERAIACLQAALTVIKIDTDLRSWAALQSNLGSLYSERLRGERGDNQEKAIYFIEASLEGRSCESDPHGWALTQICLGNLYQERLAGSREENQERAIAAYCAAESVYNCEGNPEIWASIKISLSNVYRERLSGDKAENQEISIAFCKAAMTVFGRETYPDAWARAQLNLGIAYSERLRGDRHQNKEREIACIRNAISILSWTDPLAALGNAVILGSSQRKHGQSEAALVTWREALQIRERLLREASSAEIWRAALGRSRDLVAELAVLEGELGLYTAAVATLETGRALALRDALSLDSAWLQSLLPDSQAAIKVAREQLSALRARKPGLEEASNPSELHEWEQAINLAEAGLVAALRAGGYNPLPSLEATELAALAPPKGAIVLLAAAAESGVAYIIPAGCSHLEGIHHVVLPSTTAAEMRALLIRWSEAYECVVQRRSSDPMEWVVALKAANTVLESVIEHLWDTIMEPVFERLRDLGVTSGSKLILIPQGDLALLPLHAAGLTTAGTWAHDYAVSYAPSGYALRTAQERVRRRCEQGVFDSAGRGRNLFGIFNPTGGERTPLFASQVLEMPALTKLFTELEQSTTMLSENAATLARVLADTRAAGYVHLSCHGNFNFEWPEESGLQLANDERLTLQRIVTGLDLERCRLVTLPACESGMLDVVHRPDECVGLPAAFLQAGAPGVIATFWSVFDGPTAVLMTFFYSHHLKRDEAGSSPAVALRDAVRCLREPGGTQWKELCKDDLGEMIMPQLFMVELSDLVSLPIVWAAYAHHGI